MKEFILSTEQWLPCPRDKLFPFFADAFNLEQITPPWLNFQVITPAPIVMRVGALIEYRIRIHGIPVGWRTEIVEWNPPYGFVDQQLSGPYRLWHHRHTFEEKDGGTLCLDYVRYHPIGGALMNALFVRRDVEKIFAYRRERLSALFGAGAVAATELPLSGT